MSNHIHLVIASRSRPHTVYHDWALSRCIGQAARDNEDQADAYATAAGYLERGDLGFEVYEEISNLINDYLAKPYSSKHGSELRTMKRIDLYKSEALSNLIDDAARAAASAGAETD